MRPSLFMLCKFSRHPAHCAGPSGASGCVVIEGREGLDLMARVDAGDDALDDSGDEDIVGKLDLNGVVLVEL